MDISTRFSEAIPIKKITSKIIIDNLLLFISKFGLPHEVQSDQGSCFMSNQFKQSMQELGIKHITSSAYHPESQGALERYHQTLKSMLKKYCLENDVEWDNGIPFLLFAVRDMPNDS
ncbi:DDE-type integrase/transposase/recombinase, partial [Klebsiella pneumoniae]|uniref:DDE-type integrase/transposase/recombinase n=1 Tax=Klebsiella pneumoniae TaxID=573 RepID=UPI003EB7C44F